MTREEAIKDIEENILPIVGGKSLRMAIDALRQPERKTGKWINCVNSEHWKCNQCGCRAGFWFNEENSSGWEKDMSEWLSDFCPNCGAEMTEGKE